MEHPLRKYRRENDLSLEVLAERVGTTRATISRIETLVREPSAEMMRKISAATNGVVTPNDLLGAAQPEAAA